MINIGLLGLGTVGLGIVEIMNNRKNELKSTLGKELNIKKILVKDINKERDKTIDKILLTNDFEEILNDNDISIIIEVTSELEESYQYIKGALDKGKHVVTANKAVVSKYFEELSSLAKKRDRAFLYEASVGGGIPIIKPLKEEIAINEITQVQGILNGTSNYILTRMFNEGLDYDETLKIAQGLGYAEADPTSDVEGHDTQRKLRILSTIALKGRIGEEDILVRGIKGINSFDVQQIKKLNSTVKLIAEAKATDDKFTAVVQPTIIKTDTYFANVNMAYNSITVVGNNVGELKFYGAGAGKLPTANAVLRDVLDIGKNTYRKGNHLVTRRLKNKNKEINDKYYLRITPENKENLQVLEDIVDKTLCKDDNIAIITKEVSLQKILKIVDTLNLREDDYFIGRVIN